MITNITTMRWTSFLLVLLLKTILFVQQTEAQCLNNYYNDDGRSADEWRQGSLFKNKGAIVPDFDGTLTNWQLQITFKAPLALNLEAWVLNGIYRTRGKKEIVLKPKSYNQQITSDNFVFEYIASFSSPQNGDQIECAQFCGKVVETGLQLCSLVTPSPTTPTTTVSGATPTPSAKCGRKHLRVLGQWNRGMNAFFRVKLPVNIRDYTLTVKVDRQFSYFHAQTSKVTFIAPDTYVLEKFDYNNLFKRAGKVLKLFFNAHFEPGYRPKILSIKFEAPTLPSPILICGLPDVTTTIATTTTEAPTTSTTTTTTTTEAPTTSTTTTTTEAPTTSTTTTTTEAPTTSTTTTTTEAPTTSTTTTTTEAPTTSTTTTTTEAPTTSTTTTTTEAPTTSTTTTTTEAPTTSTTTTTTEAPTKSTTTTTTEAPTTSTTTTTTEAPTTSTTTTTTEAPTTSTTTTTTEAPTTSTTTTTTEAPTTSTTTTTTEAPTTSTTTTTTEAPTTSTTTTTTEAPTTSTTTTTTEAPTTSTTTTTTEAPTTSTTTTTTEAPTTSTTTTTTEAPTTSTSTTTTEAPTTSTTTTTTEAPTTSTSTTTTTTEAPTTSSTTTTTRTPAPVITIQPLLCTPKYNYTEVLQKSLLFYEAQRSGKLPANNRVTWRKDSALNDGGDVGLDLEGGYYDAGDYVKFGFPMAAAITNLAWGMIEFKDGYINTGQYSYGLEALKWATDYFIKCHTSSNKFYGQVGNGGLDHASWGRPEDMTMARPSYDVDQSKPGTEVAAETAAAMAATSIVFRDQGNVQYADTLLQHAKELYSFANTFRRNYHLSITDAASFYRSFSGFNDELAWSSLWMYKASKLEQYKTDYLNEHDNSVFNQGIQEFSWDNKWAGAKVLAAREKITSKDYLSSLKTYINSGTKTPKGLFFVNQYGANRHAANIAFLALVAHKETSDSAYETFARGQIHYMLGDAGRSYVVGFGNNPPLRPHHRSSSCPSTGECSWNNYHSSDPNPHTLYGALVGGPDANDGYEDKRDDFIKNEVTLDYNAGFQSAIAGLLGLALVGQCGITSVVTTTTTSAPSVTTTQAVTPSVVSGSTTPTPSIKPLQCTTKYDYSEVLEKSLLFYEAQRSGKLPANNRVTWRKDSALNDGGDVGLDLEGGYYDAGDYVKFGFPMAAAITNLAWGMIEFKDGYINTGQYSYGLEALKWATDYFIKCHTSSNKFYGQVGNGGLDHASWGRPEDMTMARPSYDVDQNKPGTEVAAETAAAMAATSIVFRDQGNVQYADTLLQHAKELYSFANTFRRNYHLSITDAASFYRSFSGFNDELAWSSLWMYKASKLEQYKTDYLNEHDNSVFNQGIQEFSWDNKWAGAKVLAAREKITSKDYLSSLKTYINSGTKTPKGLFFVNQYGANRHAANIAFLALVAHKETSDSAYETFARGQIHYMLGDAGRSYVVGFGNNPPLRPHHRSSSCPSTGTCDWNNYHTTDPNPHILYGALVGGPDANDGYEDKRDDFIKNEVTLDYNAGFQSAVAGLYQLAVDGKC